MADPMRKFVPGERRPLSATMLNRFIDAAQFERESRGKGDGAPFGGIDDPAAVLVRNQSGAAVGRFGVLTPSASTIDPAANLGAFQDALCIDAATPTAAGQPIIVLLEPLAAGAIGTGVVAGAVQCQVNVSNAGHTYATTINGDAAKLASVADSSAGACPILWKQSGTGVKWAVVLLPSVVGSAGGGSSGLGGASVKRTAGFVSVNDSTWTLLEWTSADFDTASYFSGATPGLLTVPATGTYQFGCTACWDGGSSGTRHMQLTAGSVVGGHDGYHGFTDLVLSVQSVLSRPVHLTAGQQAYVQVYQDSGSPLSIFQNNIDSTRQGWFWVNRLG